MLEKGRSHVNPIVIDEHKNKHEE